MGFKFGPMTIPADFDADTIDCRNSGLLSTVALISYYMACLECDNVADF